MNDDFIVEYVHGRHTMREYFARLLEESEIAGAFLGCEQLRERCLGHLWAAFVELDSIPRTEPVWANTNLRTTFTKVRELYAGRVTIDESDLPRCWRSFTIALCCGHPDRFERAAEVLLRVGELGVPDFVRAAAHVSELSGSEADRLVVDVLVRSGLAAEGRQALAEMVKEVPARLPEWAMDRPEWAQKILARLGDGR